MRQARIKVDAAERAAVYHCMTRTVNGEQLLDDGAKEVLRKQLWQVAEFCGVQIVTYAIMSNHFHVLVRVPKKTKLSDNELVRRYRVLYPKPTRFQTARLEVIESQLQSNGDEAAQWRERQLALMGDLSAFMKLLKQRFSVWFNRTHHRFGTLWAERFKSVLVEPKAGVLRTMAAYIDLNAVRWRIPRTFAFVATVRRWRVTRELARGCVGWSRRKTGRKFRVRIGKRSLARGLKRWLERGDSRRIRLTECSPKKAGCLSRRCCDVACDTSVTVPCSAVERLCSFTWRSIEG